MLEVLIVCKHKVESMKNQDLENFFDVIGKVDNTNIILPYKSDRVFHGKHFYGWKKCYFIDLYIVCNSQKRFIYILANFLNTIYNS